MKQSGWTVALFTLTFIIGPALVAFLFFLPEWNNNKSVIEWWKMFVIGISYLALVIFVLWLFIHLKVINLESISYTFPFAVALFLIFITSDVVEWGRWMIVLLSLPTALASNIVIAKINNKRSLKK